MGSLTSNTFTNTSTNTGAPSRADYVHFLRFLLDGVSKQVIPGDGQDMKKFQSEMSNLSGSLNEHSTKEEISSLLHSGLQSLKTYNTRTAKFVTQPVVVPLSGLPDRPGAEREIAAKIASTQDCVCGIFVVNRLASIQARFGRTVVDEVVLLVAERLAQHLPTGVAVFRWSESALIALVDVDTNIADVTRRFARAASMNLEKNIETQSRFVLVPISLSFTLKRLSGSSSPPDTFQDLDQFVSVNTGDMNMLQ